MNQLQSLKPKWTGIRPMLLHNGELADPQNPYAQKIREITKKGSKKMTVEDYIQISKLEWFGSLYWDETDGLIIPADNIERCIQLGAQKSRQGKDTQAAVFCVEPHAKLIYDGPSKKEKLYPDPRFSLRKGVAVKKARVIRMRPMIPTGWSISFTLEFDSTIIDEKAVIIAMQNAGALIGLGDWRPKFGRFTVEII